MKSAITALSALVAGLIFGLGLLWSGMGNPAKVQNFLDVFGSWDPSLGLVMGGAIAVGLVAFAWAKRQKTALLGAVMQLPGNTVIDRPLLTGAALFGIGWGIAGLCPGPAIADLAIAPAPAAIFVAAMLGGMILHRLLPAPPAK